MRHLRILLVGLFVSVTQTKPEGDVKYLLSQFSQAYYQLLHAKRNWTKVIEQDNI